MRIEATYNVLKSRFGLNNVTPGGVQPITGLNGAPIVFNVSRSKPIRNLYLAVEGRHNTIAGGGAVAAAAMTDRVNHWLGTLELLGSIGKASVSIIPNIPVYEFVRALSIAESDQCKDWPEAVNYGVPIADFAIPVGNAAEDFFSLIKIPFYDPEFGPEGGDLFSLPAHLFSNLTLTLRPNNVPAIAAVGNPYFAAVNAWNVTAYGLANGLPTVSLWVEYVEGKDLNKATDEDFSQISRFVPLFTRRQQLIGPATIAQPTRLQGELEVEGLYRWIAFTNGNFVTATGVFTWANSRATCLVQGIRLMMGNEEIMGWDARLLAMQFSAGSLNTPHAIKFRGGQSPGGMYSLTDYPNAARDGVSIEILPAATAAGQDYRFVALMKRYVPIDPFFA